MSYIGQQLPADVFSGFTTDSFTGDGSATTFTLSKAPFSEDGLIVVINNVIQKPTTNFTVSGTTLTIVGTAVASGDVIYAIHTSGAVPSTLASKVDVNGLSDGIILDADADTTISADTDDQIDFKVGGVDEMTLSSTGLVINEGSNDRDFRVESNNESSMLHVNGGTDTVLIGTDTTEDGWFDADGTFVPGFMTFGHGNTDGRLSAFVNNQADAGGPIVCLGKTRATAPETYTIVQDDDQLGIISFQGGDGTTFVEGASIRVDVDGTPGGNDMPGRIEFFTTSDGSNSGSERMRVTSAGDLLIATTDQYAYDNTSDQAITLNNIGLGSFARSQGASIVGNRMTNDGLVIAVYGQGNQEGGLEVSGSTVSVSGFTGVHWSRLADNSKPTILRGTIIESIDEMCDWYAVEFEVERTKKDFEGNSVTKKYSKRQAYGLKDGESVGDTITYRYLDGKDYSAKIIKEDDVKHTKCKISDTADSKKIYGVFHRWDDTDDGSDGDVNDLEVAQVGTYIIRVNKDVTVEAGDLLVSNGDGTAKVQDDDIIRSKTVAKVNSNIKVETYSDGSYTVPCTLHC